MKKSHRAPIRALMIFSFLMSATVASAVEDGVSSTETAGTPKANAANDPIRKQWVWLTKQGVWGYGYQRADGFWMIDPGTKMSAADFQRLQQEQQAAAPAAAAPTPAAAPAAAASDPYGFVSWLNSVRAGSGLGPVGIDPNLSSWAQQNNVQQQSRGLGHYVMGPARRQNSAVGNYAGIGAMWMASPAHRAALLDPSITSVGIAGLGVYWTFNAR